MWFLDYAIDGEGHDEGSLLIATFTLFSTGLANLLLLEI